MTDEQYQNLKVVVTAALASGLLKTIEIAAKVLEALAAAQECVKQESK